MSNPMGPRNNRTLNYNRINSYHILRACYVVDTLHELCSPSQHHACYYSTFTDGETDLKKVRQLLQGHRAKEQSLD